MAIFNSYVSLPEGKTNGRWNTFLQKIRSWVDDDWDHITLNHWDEDEDDEERIGTTNQTRIMI
jgi:hypothetical protein